MPEVSIRAASPDDCAGLPALQVAAGSVFRELGMGLVADGPAPDLESLRRAAGAGHVLVAVRGDDILGFVRTRDLDGALHVEQVTVAPGAQRRGIGQALMRAVEDVAHVRGLGRLTLTTFRDVPFNGPFYRSLGWTDLSPDVLTEGLRRALRDEAAAGLDRWPRVAMAKGPHDGARLQG